MMPTPSTVNTVPTVPALSVSPSSSSSSLTPTSISTPSTTSTPSISSISSIPSTPSISSSKLPTVFVPRTPTISPSEVPTKSVIYQVVGTYDIPKDDEDENETSTESGTLLDAIPDSLHFLVSGYYLYLTIGGAVILCCLALGINKSV